MITRPMLAASRVLLIEELEYITYPKLVSYKLDGIRCITRANANHYVAPFSRSNKLLPNCHVQSWAADLPSFFDGELIIPGATFHKIQSKVMTNITLPFPFEYHVFDHWGYKGMSFEKRLMTLQIQVERYCNDCKNKVVLVNQVLVLSPSELKLEYDRAIHAGYEGLIVRDPKAPYNDKTRCTFVSEHALKMKQFEDAEAVIVGFVPEYENQNEKVKNELGYSRRSSHAGNKKARARLGALVVEEKTHNQGTIQFQIGSGFDQTTRIEIWNNQKHYLGKIVTYKHQLYGRKDKPRTPIFKSIRLD